MPPRPGGIAIRTAAAVVATAALVCAGGCALRPDGPVEALQGTHILDETPFFPQTAHHCGPAALATVLADTGVETSAETLAPYVYLEAREGSLQVELLAAARRHGRLPVTIRPTLAALEAQLAAGRPVLVLQNLGVGWLPRWHYAVVVGSDAGRGELILRSGRDPERRTPLGVFLKTWDRSERWAFVTLVPGDAPAGLEPTRYLRAVAAMEHGGDAAGARRAYRAAADAWPALALPWLGLGNLAYAAGDLAAAEDAYRAAEARAPDDAIVANNLAQVLAERGETEEALDLLERALASATLGLPLRTAVLETRREILAGAPR